MAGPHRNVVIAALVLVLAALPLALLLRGDDEAPAPAPFVEVPAGEDPFPYDPGRRADFERRAVASTPPGEKT